MLFSKTLCGERISYVASTSLHRVMARAHCSCFEEHLLRNCRYCFSGNSAEGAVFL